MVTHRYRESIHGQYQVLSFLDTDSKTFDSRDVFCVSVHAMYRDDLIATQHTHMSTHEHTRARMRRIAEQCTELPAVSHLELRSQ